MLIYITEVFALLINWITCGPYLVILLTVDWSCLPAPISTENGTWMSYCRWSGTLKLYLQYSWLLCDIFLKRNTKDVLPDMPSYPYLQSSLSSILQSTAKLIFLRHSSDHAITVWKIFQPIHIPYRINF